MGKSVMREFMGIVSNPKAGLLRSKAMEGGKAREEGEGKVCHLSARGLTVEKKKMMMIMKMKMTR